MLKFWIICFFEYLIFIFLKLIFNVYIFAAIATRFDPWQQIVYTLSYLLTNI